jgi:hypothetical protein
MYRFTLPPYEYKSTIDRQQSIIQTFVDCHPETQGNPLPGNTIQDLEAFDKIHVSDLSLETHRDMIGVREVIVGTLFSGEFNIVSCSWEFSHSNYSGWMMSYRSCYGISWRDTIDNIYNSVPILHSRSGNRHDIDNMRTIRNLHRTTGRGVALDDHHSDLDLVVYF